MEPSQIAVYHNIYISPDLFSCLFACDYKACKGICCVEGDSGAPLEEYEEPQLKQHYPAYADYLTKEGKEALRDQGFAVRDADGDLVTPLVNNAACAYARFDNQGNCFCAIEKAYLAGKIPFRKPASCWLYPIRVQKLSGDDIALNYHQWHCCVAACKKGEALQMPVYKFLKDPICAVFGEDFYNYLESIAPDASSAE